MLLVLGRGGSLFLFKENHRLVRSLAAMQTYQAWGFLGGFLAYELWLGVRETSVYDRWRLGVWCLRVHEIWIVPHLIGKRS